MPEWPTDDLDIKDDAILWRRVGPTDYAKDRPNDQGFKLRKNKNEAYLSVYLANELGLYERLLEGENNQHRLVARFTAGGMRNLKDDAGHMRDLRIRPEPDDSDLPGHCGIYGADDDIRRIADIAEWEVPPTTAKKL